MKFGLYRFSCLLLLSTIVILQSYAQPLVQVLKSRSTSGDDISYSKNGNSKPASPVYKRLFINDQLPFKDFTFNQTRNYRNKSLKWSDLKSKKLIILDFWSKYCSSCIAALPKMEKFQQTFDDDIQILPITYNTKEELEDLFNRSTILKKITLPMIMGDTIFNKFLFPHNTVPYHVWLDGNGKVIATVSQQETTLKNISDYLKGNPLEIQIREENIDDPMPKGIDSATGSFLKVENGRLINQIIYYAQIPKDRIPNTISRGNKQVLNSNNIALPLLSEYSIFLNGMPQYNVMTYQGILTDAQGNERGLKFFNYTIDQLIQLAYQRELNEYTTDYSSFKMRWLVDKDAGLLYEDITDTTNEKRHLISNQYSYESNMNDFSHSKAYKLLKDDISRCFGLKAIIENREVKCAVLKIVDSTKLKKNFSQMKNSTLIGEVIRDNNKVHYINTDLNLLLSSIFVANRSNESPFFIYEKNIPIDMIINLVINSESNKLDVKNLSVINDGLNKLGMIITLEYRNVDILVLHSSL